MPDPKPRGFATLAEAMRAIAEHEAGKERPNIEEVEITDPTTGRARRIKRRVRERP